MMSNWTEFSVSIFSLIFLNLHSEELKFWRTKRLQHSREKVKEDENLCCSYIFIQGLGLFCAFLGGLFFSTVLWWDWNKNILSRWLNASLSKKRSLWASINIPAALQLWCRWEDGQGFSPKGLCPLHPAHSRKGWPSMFTHPWSH